MLQLFKAQSDGHDQAKQNFKQFLEEESVPMRRAFSNFVEGMLDDVTDAQITAWIENKDLKGFLDFASDYIDDMSDTLPKTFVRAANNEIARLSQPGVFGTGKLGIKFDPGAANAADVMEQSRLSFIKDFTSKQRDAVKAALDDALKGGKGPAAAARQFRDAIGLTENQYRAVQNYQRALENGSKTALERALRDARFDRTISRTIENNDVLSSKQIERMVGRYTENMRNYRAMNIARTETMRAINQAKQESWAQIADKLGIDPDKVERTWITTMDGRERDSHADMDRQTVMGLEEPFESGDGEELMYPGDPDASLEETINCRCTVIVRFPPAPRQIGKAFNPDEPRDEHGKWTSFGSALSSSENDAVLDYTSKYFRHMNARLNSGKKLMPDQQSLADRLDAVMAKSTFGSDETLYRGFRSSDKFDLAELRAGDNFKINAYVSTSKEQAVAASYGSSGDRNNHTGKLLQIEAPRGAHGIDVHGHNLTRQSYEQEVLLPRNSKFVVTGTEDRTIMRGINKDEPWSYKVVHAKVVSASEHLSKDYNPDEVRDDHGRWTAGTVTTITHRPTGARANIIHSSVKGQVVVDNVTTPDGARGRGGADRVMSAVTNHLDEHGYHATLVPSPADATTNEAGLRRLYERHGFKPGSNNMKMVRDSR